MKRFFASLLLLNFGVGTASAAPAGLDKVLVSVNGVPIRQSEVIERLLKRYGASAVDEMIDEMLLREASKKAGLANDESEVNRRLSRLQEQFGSRELFISQLEQAGSSVAKVKEDLAEEISRERLVAKEKGLKVTPDEIRKAFDENKDKLGTPPAVHLRHILVAKESDAQNLVTKIKAGADFKALAREKSLAVSGKAAGGDYGFVARGMLPPEIEDIAFSMKPGEIRVVPGPRGSHLLQVLEARPAKPADFATVKDDLRAMLMADKIKRAAPEYLQGLRRAADIKASDAVPPALRSAPK